MRRTTLLLMTLALAAGSLPAGAHILNPPASKVLSISAAAGSGTVSVDGTASFGGQRLKLIGDDPPSDENLAQAAGPYDLVQARLGQLDAATGVLTFVMKLRDLPINGSVPEAARYTWDFGIDMGGAAPVPFSIDGKFTDVIRNQSTRSPSFVLQGDCTTDANNIITCVDIADLTAEMIGSDNEIFIDVPLAPLEAETKGSIAGRPIVPVDIWEGIAVHPAAYFSAGGTGDTLVWDAETNPYRVAYKRVQVGIAPLGQTPAQMVDATLHPDGSFAGSLDTTGLSPGTYDVLARACYGENCGTRTTTITI